jgi:long-subunit fatty acid transport protein
MRWVVAIVLALGAGRASANPFEVLGLTSRHAGQASAAAASVDDAAALYYNPAGLVATPGIEVSIGTIGAYSHLQGTGKLADPAGAQLAMKAPLPLRGSFANRIVVGVALHVLPGDVAHIIAPRPDEPYDPYYGDRMSRIVILPGAAVRFGRLAVGVSFDVLAGFGGTLEASEGATRAIDARADQRIPTVARVIAGATWQLTPSVRLGAVFHQRFELPFATTTKTLVAGEPIDLDIKASGLFTPHQLVLGGAWTRGKHVISFDARYSRWSGYPGPYVRVDSRLPIVGDVPALEPRVPFDDTLGGRLGIESRIGRHWFARGGYGFETSPVPARQTGVTNLLDGPRHTLAVGAGRAWGRARLDAHVQLQLVQHRTLDKELFDGKGAYDPFTSLRDEDLDTPEVQITNPGFPGITGGGQVVSGGVTLEVGL